MKRLSQPQQPVARYRSLWSRSVKLAAALLAIALVLPHAALAAGTVDQEYTAWRAYWSSFSPTDPLAQTFTAGATDSLTQVDLYIAINAQDHPGTLTIQIQSLDNNELPSGTVLGSGNVPESSVGANWGWISVSLSEPASVIAGTRYAIVAFGASSGWYKGALGCHNTSFCSNLLSPDYAGGDRLVRVSDAWSVDNDHDFLFRTYVASPDTTPPQISCGSADGVWHNNNVSIACSTSDSESGLVNSADANFSLSTNVAAGNEDANASTNSRQVCDAAGNCAPAGPISGNKVDRKAPSMTISAPTNTTYLLNQAVAASYTCTDGGSGVATCAGPVASGSNVDTSSIGTKSFTVNAADSVGNSAQQGVSYQVIYKWSGFFQPIDNAPTVNVVKAGSAVPVKFSLGGNQGLSIFAAGSPASKQITCDSGAPVDDIEQTVTAGSSTLSYDSASNTYSYVWKTDKTWTSTCRQLSVTLNDGTVHTANFKFK